MLGMLWRLLIAGLCACRLFSAVVALDHVMDLVGDVCRPSRAMSLPVFQPSRMIRGNFSTSIADRLHVFHFVV